MLGVKKGEGTNPQYVLPTSWRPWYWNPSWLKDAHTHQEGLWVRSDVGNEQDDWPEEPRELSL